jgi:hypothetical protein
MEKKMRQILIRKPKKRTHRPLDLRTPLGRELPY